MEKEADQNEKRLRDLAAMIAVHFGDFLLVVKPKDGGFGWTQSDSTWGLGACERYAAHIKDESLIAAMDRRMEDQD